MDELFGNDVGSFEQDRPISMFIDLEDGFAIRRFKPSPSLGQSNSRGDDVEHLIREIATRWGFPELIYWPNVVKIGSGNREISDAIMLGDKQAVSIQVKSRNAETNNARRSRQWVSKNTAKAVRQSSGTIRTLRLSPKTLTNARGSKLSIDGNSYDWATLVVVDIPNVPSNFIPDLQSDYPLLVLTRPDFEFLFDQLKSVAAVIAYIHRVANLDRVALGMELKRYHGLAFADLNTESVPRAHLFQSGARDWSNPMLPLGPVGHDDSQALDFLRKVFEDLGIVAFHEQTPTEIAVKVFGVIDQLPVQGRVELGRHLLDVLDELRVIDFEVHGIQWRFRFVFGSDKWTQVVLGAANHFDPERSLATFHSRLQLAHLDLQEREGKNEDELTVGLLITPRKSEPLSWDSSLVVVSQEIELDTKSEARLRTSWGRVTQVSDP